MMDRIKEKKGKFNIFDALLILLILAVIAGGVFFFLRKNTSTATDANTKETPIHYTIRYRMISDQLHVVLQTGDTLQRTKQWQGKSYQFPQCKPKPQNSV